MRQIFSRHAVKSRNAKLCREDHQAKQQQNGFVIHELRRLVDRCPLHQQHGDRTQNGNARPVQYQFREPPQCDSRIGDRKDNPHRRMLRLL